MTKKLQSIQAEVCLYRISYDNSDTSSNHYPIYSADPTATPPHVAMDVNYYHWLSKYFGRPKVCELKHVVGIPSVTSFI